MSLRHPVSNIYIDTHRLVYIYIQELLCKCAYTYGYTYIHELMHCNTAHCNTLRHAVTQNTTAHCSTPVHIYLHQSCVAAGAHCTHRRGACALQHTTTHYNTTHCNTLQHTHTHPLPQTLRCCRFALDVSSGHMSPATHCDTLQHNTLQHTTAHSYTSTPTNSALPQIRTGRIIGAHAQVVHHSLRCCLSYYLSR